MFSIILPTFNRGYVIERALNSIKFQTYKNFECIIVDDGSTDNTMNVCSKIIKGDKRFIYIKTENRGVSSARNKALSVCNGDYVLFVDSDDFISLNALEVLKSKINSLPDIVVFEGDEYCSKGCRMVYTVKSERMILGNYIIKNPDFIKTNIYTALCNKLYSKKFILKNFDTDINIGEDFAFFLANLKKDTKIVFLKENIYHCTNDDTSLSVRKDINNLKRYKKMYLRLKEKCSINNFGEKFDIFLNQYFAKICITCIKQIYSQHIKGSNVKNKLSEEFKDPNIVACFKAINCSSFKNFNDRIVFMLLKYNFFTMLDIILKTKNLKTI